MTGERKYLHIVNGDFAAKLWEKAALEGDCIVWRETYLEGPLPETEDLQSFREARAEYLSTFAETTGIGKIRLCLFLQKLDDSVLNLPENAALILWFDSCIFDQTILMRILWLVEQRKSTMPKVLLYCCQGNCLAEEDFKNSSGAIRLYPDDVSKAARAWELFLKKDGSGMCRLADSGEWSRLPAMKKALRRCAEELPGKDGLTRTQRQLLQLIAAGKHSFVEIFKGFDAFEEFPFLGDTACQRHLDFLAEKGFIIREGDSYRISGSP